MSGIFGSLFGAIREVFESIDQGIQDMRNAEMPGTLEERRMLGRMYDDGYGEHYFDAYFKAKEGEVISAGDREVLERYGLLEKAATPVASPAEAVRPELADDRPAPGPTGVSAEGVESVEEAA